MLHYTLIPSNPEEPICGKTKLGENIVDILIEASMIFSNFTTVSSDQIKPKIHDSLNLYSQIDSKVSFFLYSAIQEKDRLKQFLFFFFAIEIYTHQTFKRIDFRNYVNGSPKKERTHTEVKNRCNDE